MVGPLTYIVTVSLNEKYIQRKKYSDAQVLRATECHLGDALRYDERFSAVSIAIVPAPENIQCATCHEAGGTHLGWCAMGFKSEAEWRADYESRNTAEPVERKFEPVPPDVILPAPNQFQDNYEIAACNFCKLTLPCRPISVNRGGKICKPCYVKRNDLL